MTVTAAERLFSVLMRYFISYSKGAARESNINVLNNIKPEITNIECDSFPLTQLTGES